jgi:peptide deformylase
MELKLVYFGNPILRKKAKQVDVVDESIIEIVRNMDKVMQESKGVGLAAPQVGISLRIFILRDEILVDGSEDEWISGPLEVFINPVLSNPSAHKVVMNEGCLSIPGVRADVERPKSLTVEALGIDGKPFKRVFNNLPARIIMHENDHLNGVLFIDRLSQKIKDRIEPKLKEIKKKFNF